MCTYAAFSELLISHMCYQLAVVHCHTLIIVLALKAFVDVDRVLTAVLDFEPGMSTC